MLQSRRFSLKFRNLIKPIIHNGYLFVQINDVSNNYFVDGEGLKQGDPLSPNLFNLTADVFTQKLA
jgi:hypothetical protein